LTTFEVSAAPGEADSWVLTIVGDVDLATAPEVLDAGNDVFAKAEPSRLVLELSGVTFIDSTGLGALVQLRNLTQERGIALLLSSPSRSVSRAMSLAGLADVFGLSEDTDGAGTS